ncbi:hypothetical protein C0Q70_05576 [Pomacea canaliculata]|uniref:VWFA domain-containing protein n=1 Tax=Pomacea canaliculata TaxID=400727 RepID=A0A2T7PLJ7_POMCA|nr:hypothetical protein C0Q70_05576 [Pomacea canaliculata]
MDFFSGYNFISSLSGKLHSAVKFDISHKNGLYSAENGDTGESDETTFQKTPAKEWEIDVRPQVSSHKWLQNYGLRKARLHMDQILPSIGFKLSDDFDPAIKRPISSRYGRGLFQQIFGAHGKTFNISCSREKLLQLKKRLSQSLALFRRRLEWLTSESRRIFGVVEEKAVTVVMDIRNMSPEQFDQYRTALERTMREQFVYLTKFNLIRAAEDMQQYSSECIPLSHDTLEDAIQWMWNLDRLAAVSNTACTEAILKAVADNFNEAVYLFTEGSSIDCGRELLLEKVKSTKKKIPIHVVSFNCDSSDTVKFLRNFATLTGAGVREDVVLIFEEMEEARNNLQQVEMLIEQTPEPSRVLSEVKSEKVEKAEKDEQYMTSKEWLTIYGLEALKLGLYDVLAGVAFKHLDGVVEILEKPPQIQTNAVGHEKLINAQYCERFPVVRWKDGRVVHVQVTPEVHRNYEQRMQVALNKIQQRVDWLKHGSRALFGTVVEEEIYILIDTSASMQHHIQFVKERLFVLMQEQIRHKSRFNIIAFNTKVSCWRDRLVDVNERSLQSAWTWIQGLTCWGSTNTYSAVQTALADICTQAIYLLTDGRPDQVKFTAKVNHCAVQMQKKVPIHTISFNCDDTEANQFLYDLAQATEGRYHYFSEKGSSDDQPKAWESQDIALLKDEIQRGIEWMDQLAELRDQCTLLSWHREIDDLKKCSKGHLLPEQGKASAIPAMEPREIFRPNSPLRPASAPLQSSRHIPTPPLRPSSSTGHHPQRSPRRPHSARSLNRSRKLVACHTRTSLFRTMSSSGRFSPSGWLLPETSQLFERQACHQQSLAKKSTHKERQQKVRRNKLAQSKEMSCKEWLKKHGLVAQRLTILDALAPTLIRHRAKYIPILDKHVVARVFDEILPIAHVSGRKSNQVTLVNPNAVNLEEYEERLERALDMYRQYLNKMVWDALPETAKKEFGDEGPVSFDDHRGRLLQILNEEGWPVTEKDIVCLEREIEKGMRFLQQSKDLRQAAADVTSNVKSSPRGRKHSPMNDGSQIEERTDQDTKACDDADDIHGSDDDKSDDGKVVFKPRTPRPSDNPQSLSPGSPIPQEELHGPEPPSRPRKKGLSNKKQQRCGVKLVRKRPRIMVSMMRGTRVIARSDKDGQYYEGTVVKCPSIRTATVELADGEHVVLTRFIIPVSGAVACPPLSVGDCCLVRVIYLDEITECYVPGIVQIPPKSHQDQFYTLLLYNRQRVTTRRNCLVKISRERYELTVHFIEAVQGEHRSRERSLSRSSTDDDSPNSLSSFSKPSSPLSKQESSSCSPAPENRSQSDVGSTSRSRTPISQRQEELVRLQQQLEEQQCKQKKMRQKLKKRAKHLKRKERKMLSLLGQIVEKTKTEDEGRKTPTHESVIEDEQPIITPRLLRLRRSLPALNVAEEVLARFSDDGWYYHGGCLRGGQAPNYISSYAPGHALSVMDTQQAAEIEFFDGQKGLVPRAEIYRMPQDKYNHDVLHIQQRLRDMVGLSVVSRDDKTGQYVPAQIVGVENGGQYFSIRWSDGSHSRQLPLHIFSARTRRRQLITGDHVLAIAVPELVVFLPGQIIRMNQNTYSVRFCDGQISDDVNPVFCYWLSQNYFDEASYFWKISQPDFGLHE